MQIVVIILWLSGSKYWEPQKKLVILIMGLIFGFWDSQVYFEGQAGGALRPVILTLDLNWFVGKTSGRDGNLKISFTCSLNFKFEIRNYKKVLNLKLSASRKLFYSISVFNIFKTKF